MELDRLENFRIVFRVETQAFTSKEEGLSYGGVVCESSHSNCIYHHPSE